jgi:hypothetical protein
MLRRFGRVSELSCRMVRQAVTAKAGVRQTIELELVMPEFDVLH